MGAWNVAEHRLMRRPEPAGSYRGRLQARLMQSIVLLAVWTALLLFANEVRGGAWWTPVGLATLAVGAGLRLWAIRTLDTQFSYELTIQSDHAIIEAGPYRKLRHPSYTGLILVTAGAAWTLQAPWVGVAGAFAMFVLAAWRVREEEAILHERFGETYARYAKRSWRLVPLLW